MTVRNKLVIFGVAPKISQISGVKAFVQVPVVVAETGKDEFFIDVLYIDVKPAKIVIDVKLNMV